MQAFPLIINFLVMPLFFLFGALFPIQGTASAFETIAHFNPLGYGVDGLRGSLTGATHFGLLLDLAVLSGITLILFAIGSWMFERIEP